MSAMPAEGSQTPQELSDLADTSSTTSPPTKAKTPDKPVPPRLGLPGADLAAGFTRVNPVHHQNDEPQNEHAPEVSSGHTWTSGVPLTGQPKNMVGSNMDQEPCQGTAHFYRQSTQRHAPASGNPNHPLNGGSVGVQINGEIAQSALVLEPQHPQCHCNNSGSLAGGQLDLTTDGMLPPWQVEEWQITNGYQQSEAIRNGLGPGDDMESYFNANAHMLAYLDIHQDEEQQQPVTSHGAGECALYSGVRQSRPTEHQSQNSRCPVSYHNGYRHEDTMVHNGLETYSPARASKKLSTSSEELGDFIETDISLPPQDIDESCDNSTRVSSSEEDLPRLTTPPETLRPYQMNMCGNREQYSAGTTQRPLEGPTLTPPSSVQQQQPHTPTSVCDYKASSTSTTTNTVTAPATPTCRESSRPVSFGVSNRLCTCSVVSYLRRRPPAPSNQSSSDLDADEGVGGMKSSPLEPSPVESEDRLACGLTLKSDSSSYFSPEDVDFMDFDMATPSDNVGEFEMGANIVHSEEGLLQSDHHHHHGNAPINTVSNCHYQRDHQPRNISSQRGSSDSGTPSWINADPCDDCGKPEQECLCAGLRSCKRLLEDAQQHQASPHQLPIRQIDVERPLLASRLCSSSSNLAEHDVQPMACGCCSDSMAGRDSGAGSQEHLDTISCDDGEDEDDAFSSPVAPPHRTCSCSYQVCGGSSQRDDTNNLDVEVFSAAPSSDYEDELFNVSRQTSTSNFDQDENAYQDAVDDCTSNGFHSACSGSDLESEKSNHIPNHNQEGEERVALAVQQHHPPSFATAAAEPPSPQPPEIPLPIPARGADHGPRQPPSVPSMSPEDHQVGLGAAGCPDCGGGDGAGGGGRGAERPPWIMDNNQLPSPLYGPHQWRDYHHHRHHQHSLPCDRPDPAHLRHRPAWIHPNHTESLSPGVVSYLEHEFVQQEDVHRHNGTMDNLHNREDGRSLPSEFLGASDNNHTEQDAQELSYPDPLPDIFILNLLREKESRALYGASQARSAVEKVMIWNEYEAYVLQVKQIGASACGATAVINVLKAFNIYVDKSVVSRAIRTNTRAEKAPVAEYLLSRSVAGCTARCLMEGIEEVTGGEIVGRFFSFYPQRQVDICHWLGQWMKKGAVAVLTLNLQRAVPQGWDIPDAWHHQMAYGVGPKGVYLTNPLEIVPEEVIFEQLTSDSELLIQRQDVISRWTADTDLCALLTHPDARWRQFNVIGQVVNVLREARRPRVLGFRPQLTRHVRIPSWYRPGITLFVRRNSHVHRALLAAPALPLDQPTAHPPHGSPHPGGEASSSSPGTSNAPSARAQSPSRPVDARSADVNARTSPPTASSPQHARSATSEQLTVQAGDDVLPPPPTTSSSSTRAPGENVPPPTSSSSSAMDHTSSSSSSSRRTLEDLGQRRRTSLVNSDVVNVTVDEALVQQGHSRHPGAGNSSTTLSSSDVDCGGSQHSPGTAGHARRQSNRNNPDQPEGVSAGWDCRPGFFPPPPVRVLPGTAYRGPAPGGASEEEDRDSIEDDEGLEEVDETVTYHNQEGSSSGPR